MKTAHVLWFTGLSGAGKTTLSKSLEEYFVQESARYLVLDGDRIRATIAKHLRFTPADIEENNRLIIEECLRQRNSFDFIVVAAISPFRKMRNLAREKLAPGFSEIYLNAPLAKVAERDVKGLYRRALSGEIPFFIGVDERTPYEPPSQPELILFTGEEGFDVSLRKLIAYVQEKNGSASN